MIINDGLGSIQLTQNGPRSWMLQQSFTYITKAGKEIVIPQGFPTDGASSPLHILIRALDGHYSTATIIHDYLYWRLDTHNPSDAAPTRYDADNILFEVMDHCGVAFLVKWGIWWVVRTFGGPDFRAGETT